MSKIQKKKKKYIMSNVRDLPISVPTGGEEVY